MARLAFRQIQNLKSWTYFFENQTVPLLSPIIIIIITSQHLLTRFDSFPVHLSPTDSHAVRRLKSSFQKEKSSPREEILLQEKSFFSHLILCPTVIPSHRFTNNRSIIIRSDGDEIGGYF